MPSKNMISWSLKKTTLNGGAAPIGVQLLDPAADKAEIERALQMAVEVIRRDEIL
jgi:hypothetical protein